MKRRKSSLLARLCGSKYPRRTYTIKHETDISVFRDFQCGVPSMDEFIHGVLEMSVKNHFCQLYSVRFKRKISALFALTFDSLALDNEDKNDLLDADSLCFSDAYEDIFWNKRHYPALEISYLAVREDLRGYGF